jgi:hypothetical protein
MYDIKIYEGGRERETIRGLSLSQASAIQGVLDRHEIQHEVKRLTPGEASSAKADKALGFHPCALCGVQHDPLEKCLG